MRLSSRVNSRLLAAAIWLPWVPPDDPITPTLPPQPGVWTTAGELALLPTSGPAWNALFSAGNASLGSPRLRDIHDQTEIGVMARGLLYARTGETHYRDEVIAACVAAMGTEREGTVLGLARNLAGYVIAADLVDLPPPVKGQFGRWLRDALDEELDGRTLRTTHEDRPNNWGTHAGGSRAAVARYLGDDEELARVARVFKGWLGDREAYSQFVFGPLWWQSDPLAPVGINPMGATLGGFSVDGVLPDDQRRSGQFFWPPPQENYVYEALQGALLQAVVLHRAGYDVWEWEDQALLRAFTWLDVQAAFPAEGDDTGLPHVVNFYYGSNFPAPIPSQPGKNFGFTDWTHVPPP
ncbi:MAG: alginate lyase family protein [Planctomycetota bacterium]